MNAKNETEPHWQSLNVSQRGLPVLIALLVIGTRWTLGEADWTSLVPIAMLLGIYYCHKIGMEIALLMFPFWLMGEVYFAQSHVIHDLRGDIHITAPLAVELEYFGITTNEDKITLAKWFQSHTHPVLDFLTGLAYIGFLPGYIGAAFYYRFVEGRAATPSAALWKLRALTIMWALCIMNVCGYITYIIYPAAPPWYVDVYGLGPAVLDAPPDPAGTSRFDALIGYPLFEHYYSQNQNIFGAIPSLHCAQTCLGFYFAILFRSLRIATGLLFFFVLFGSVYLNHHYLIDSLIGIAYALIAGSMAWYFLKQKTNATIDSAP